MKATSVRLDKKNEVKGFADFLDVPEPEWVVFEEEVKEEEEEGEEASNGEKKDEVSPENKTQKPFLTSKCFICAFLELQVRDTEYIKTADIQEFTDLVFSEVDVKVVNVKSLKAFAASFVNYFEHTKKRWTSIKDLYKYLEALMESNLFLKMRGRLMYSSVDVMQIWTHYNKDNTMSLDNEEATIFVFDLLRQDQHRCTPRLIEAVKQKLVDLSQDDNDEITLRGLTRMLSLEKSIMKQYENLQDLDISDQERILSFYDQDDEGQISGCELYALIKDVMEANGEEDPYNMDVILQAVDFLQQEGAISPMGNLDKHFYEVVFRLGLKQTSL